MAEAADPISAYTQGAETGMKMADVRTSLAAQAQRMRAQAQQMRHEEMILPLEMAATEASTALNLQTMSHREALHPLEIQSRNLDLRTASLAQQGQMLNNSIKSRELGEMERDAFEAQEGMGAFNEWVTQFNSLRRDGKFEEARSLALPPIKGSLLQQAISYRKAAMEGTRLGDFNRVMAGAAEAEAKNRTNFMSRWASLNGEQMAVLSKDNRQFFKQDGSPTPAGYAKMRDFELVNARNMMWEEGTNKVAIDVLSKTGEDVREKGEGGVITLNMELLKKAVTGIRGDNARERAEYALLTTALELKMGDALAVDPDTGNIKVDFDAFKNELMKAPTGDGESYKEELIRMQKHTLGSLPPNPSAESIQKAMSDASVMAERHLEALAQREAQREAARKAAADAGDNNETPPPTTQIRRFSDETMHDLYNLDRVIKIKATGKSEVDLFTASSPHAFIGGAYTPSESGVHMGTGERTDDWDRKGYVGLETTNVVPGWLSHSIEEGTFASGVRPWLLKLVQDAGVPISEKPANKSDLRHQHFYMMQTGNIGESGIYMWDKNSDDFVPLTEAFD